MEPLKCGIVGLSEGNGHPYSWSAICNGYEPAAMADCPFPVIPRYLSQQDWPAARLPELSVTHVWTQDPALSAHVARAARIPHVVEELGDLVGRVDAVLLARDDPDRHVEMALPFLRAGLPVYVDKPLATSLSDAERLYAAARQPWQLFSCSALAYAPELQLSAAQRATVGRVRCVDAVVPKSWEKYAVHVVEPALNLLGTNEPPLTAKTVRTGDLVAASFAFAGGQLLTVRTMGRIATPLALRVHGERGYVDLDFKDSFTAFRAALAAFARQVRGRKLVIPRERTTAVVRLLALGLRP